MCSVTPGVESLSGTSLIVYLTTGSRPKQMAKMYFFLKTTASNANTHTGPRITAAI